VRLPVCPRLRLCLQAQPYYQADCNIGSESDPDLSDAEGVDASCTAGAQQPGAAAAAQAGGAVLWSGARKELLPERGPFARGTAARRHEYASRMGAQHLLGVVRKVRAPGVGRVKFFS